MKKYLRKGIAYLLLGFIVMFVLRLGYGYLAPNDAAPAIALGDSNVAEQIESKANYASEKLKVDRGPGNQPLSVDQKYEKIAAMHARTKTFEEDEKKVRDLIKGYNAQIQFEQNAGLPGGRRVNMAIGVQPEKFDRMVAALKSVGTLSSLQINKTDKTNEYKDLNVKRVSLEKARDALIALKSKAGRIDESINLESKILEMETELQETGVKLGEYDAENEFCTIKASLEEGGPASTVHIPFLYRVRVALEWTIKYYLLTVATLLLGTLVTMVTVLVLERLKVIPASARA
jgi:hypothetical protein